MVMYRRRLPVGSMARFRFGCSGWDYQEWIGPFYRNASESKLRAYARVFDTAEINSTFYRAPSPGMVPGSGGFTPDDFVFAAKVPRNFTFALEPRNKSWMTMEAFDLLRSTGVAYTIVDEPLLPPDLHVTSPAAYLRWHGHGTDPWYNYHYSEDELKTWVPRVQQVA